MKHTIQIVIILLFINIVINRKRKIKQGQFKCGEQIDYLPPRSNTVRGFQTGIITGILKEYGQKLYRVKWDNNGQTTASSTFVDAINNETMQKCGQRLGYRSDCKKPRFKVGEKVDYYASNAFNPGFHKGEIKKVIYNGTGSNLQTHYKVTFNNGGLTNDMTKIVRDDSELIYKCCFKLYDRIDCE